VASALASRPLPIQCAACGAADGFDNRVVVDRRLARQWRLDSAERAAMNVQQGNTCRSCGNNLRGRCLADAIVRQLGGHGPLRDLWRVLPPTRVLEINPAAALTPMLSGAARHVCTTFPQVDMQRLPFGDGEFDLVVHSDTLEHVADPVQGMRECLRVVGEGWVVFTVPVVAGRLTRSRRHRLPSYHGGESGPARVHWEFGSDIVELLLGAGARHVTVNAHGHPYAVALSCQRHRVD
jgi:SAM-dependent methyltransferase